MNSIKVYIRNAAEILLRGGQSCTWSHSPGSCTKKMPSLNITWEKIVRETTRLQHLLFLPPSHSPSFLVFASSLSSFLPFFCPNSLPYLRISHLPLDSRSISLSIIITICYSSSISPPRAIRPLPQAPTPSRYLTRLSLVLYPLNTSHYPPLPRFRITSHLPLVLFRYLKAPAATKAFRRCTCGDNMAALRTCLRRPRGINNITST